MFLKVVGVVAWVLLPWSAMLWYQSHAYPFQRRYDVTLYQSLRVYLREGVCSLSLLSMPTKTASRSQFASSLHYDATPQGRSLFLNSVRQGPYRTTWLAFPLWLSTMSLASLGLIPVVLGPIRRMIRLLKGWCLECGYNLAGNRSGRCPECGQRIR